MIRKLRKKLGFTMSELLIVVAIIAVLVAIAIPIFNAQLEKSREAYDVYTMRQAASLAVEYYHQGIKGNANADAAGLVWWKNGNDDGDSANAAGVYDPGSGKFLKKKSSEISTGYGKGTKADTKATYTYQGDRKIYSPTEDYTNAVVMVAIYPNGTNKHIDIYWKYSKAAPGNLPQKYVGGEGNGANDPKYSIRINLN